MPDFIILSFHKTNVFRQTELFRRKISPWLRHFCAAATGISEI